MTAGGGRAAGVGVVEHAFIEMSDGCRLAAKLWIPDGAEAAPVPAILEYIPYRKNDLTLLRDEGTHGYFASNGYACARVDLRGSGDSDGILEDEYLPLEQADAIEVIAFLASQPWCSGAVGMIGISWGGFVGLQVAAHAPAELRAVVSIGSTVDRYAEDVHYVGGGVEASTMLYWASNMLAYNALPPDAEVAGDSWRRIWFDRMERTPPYVEAWLSHQRRDAYWKQGSVCEDYSRIRCPVLMVAGWYDSYRDSVLRYLAEGPPPARGLIGPWGHQYPQDGSPGPRIGFLQECLRFFDRHLKALDNGLDAEPAARLYLQEAVRPGDPPPDRRGRWIALQSWPAPAVRSTTWFPHESGSLAPSAGSAFSMTTSSRRVLGLGGGRLGGPSPDQSHDDSLALSFTTAPLEQDLAIVGFPRATLEVSLDRREGQVATRLCDLWPDGASTRITGGVLNLSHHSGHEHPEALEPGRHYVVTVEMKAIAYVVPAGHRLRLAVSAGLWPLLWPSPEVFTMRLHVEGDTVLEVPVIDDPAALESCPPHFLRPERAPLPAHELVPVRTRLPPMGVAERDLTTGRLSYVTSSRPRDRHVRFVDSDLQHGEASRDTFTIVEGEPLSAQARSDVQVWLSRGPVDVRIETSSTMSATAEDFLVSNQLEAYEGNVRVFTKAWHSRIPRHHV